MAAVDAKVVAVAMTFDVAVFFAVVGAAVIFTFVVSVGAAIGLVVGAVDLEEALTVLVLSVSCLPTLVVGVLVTDVDSGLTALMVEPRVDNVYRSVAVYGLFMFG